MNFLGIDIGTTCCKGQLFDDNGEILFYRSEEVELKKGEDGNKYIDTKKIVGTVLNIITQAAGVAQINSVAVSSLGESFVLLDKEDNIIFDPMLYTDARGEKQAQEVGRTFGKGNIFRLTGVYPHPMYSLYKLLWIKENHPEIFDKAERLMLICDYIGYVLTGERVIDYSLAARTGAFDIVKKEFSAGLLKKLGIPPSLFSAPAPTGSIVGKLLKKSADKCNVGNDCVLVLGSHDQICAALGAGVVKAGQAADGMGTVECITAVFDGVPDNIKLGKMGYPIVPFAQKGLYCTYILNYSSGSLVDWFRKKILLNFPDGADFFGYMEEKIGRDPSGILLLPYFAGAATPYQDVRAKGAAVGLTLDTEAHNLYRAVLEGTAYEMRLNLETVKPFGIDVKQLTATGGGSKSASWLKLKADITGLPVSAIRSGEGGLCGTAVLQAAALGRAADLEEACSLFVRHTADYLPDVSKRAEYDILFGKYKKLYRSLKALF